MNFAGLDLSKIDVKNLQRNDLSRMYRAFRTSYETGYGAIDYNLVNELILNLRKYIKINLIDVRLSIFGYVDNMERISPASLRMAMAIYMMPLNSLFDREAISYLVALQSFSNIEKINEIRSRPFSVSNLKEMWQELKTEQKKLDISGVWSQSSDFMYTTVNNQLLKNAYGMLRAIEMQGNTPVDLALKIVHYLEIIYYIEKRTHDVDYRLLMDSYYGDGKNLRDLTDRVKHLLRLNIIRLQGMPDYHPGVNFKNCNSLFFRAKLAIANSLGIARLSKQAPRVRPSRSF